MRLVFTNMICQNENVLIQPCNVNPISPTELSGLALKSFQENKFVVELAQKYFIEATMNNY